MGIEVGEAVPPATLKRLTPDGIKDFDLADLFNGKKVIVFGVPGAYTPVCSTQHLPGYIAEAEKLKADGVSAIACISVNDPFVMSAWGEQYGADGKVLMLSDVGAKFTRSLGLSLDLSDIGLGERSQRYSMIVEDGIVSTINVEKSIFDHDASSASSLTSSASA